MFVGLDFIEADGMGEAGMVLNSENIKSIYKVI